MRDIRITRSRDAEIINATNILTWINQTDTSWFDRHYEKIVSQVTSSRS